MSAKSLGQVKAVIHKLNETIARTEHEVRTTTAGFGGMVEIVAKTLDYLKFELEQLEQDI